MSRKPDDPHPGSEGPDAPSYEVGYGKPPKQHRFQPGRSGNPHGRPKGATNKPRDVTNNGIREIILKEARRTVPINDATGPLTLTMVEAVVRAQAVTAAKGSVRAQRDFLALAREAEREEQDERAAVLVGVIEYKMQWEAEMKRRRRWGHKGSGPKINPDDLGFDEVTGRAYIRGPATEEETARWQGWRDQLREELSDLVRRRNYPACRGRSKDQILAEIERSENALALAQAALDGSRQAMRALEQIDPDGVYPG